MGVIIIFLENISCQSFNLFVFLNVPIVISLYYYLNVMNS